MARRLRVEASALLELGESALSLDREQPGLGEELTTAVGAVFGRILDRPTTYPIIGTWFGHETRSALERRFKFRIVFVVRPRSVWVISIARQSRRPLYWRGRLRTKPPE